MEHKCRDCGSERLIPNVPFVQGAAPGQPQLQLRARVCADCGYTELRAENALDLYLLHVKSAGSPAAAVAAAGETPAPAVNIQCPKCGSVIPAASATCPICGWSETGNS
jgi:ribosomal protein L37E